MFQLESYNQLNTSSKYHYVESYLLSFYKLIQQQLACNNRVTCLRIDLHFPKNIHYQDPACISRFIEAFKARLNTWKSQRNQHHPLGFSYVWVRERAKSHNWHYHLVLFFNKDAFAHLGKLEVNRDNLYSRIVNSWASAVNINKVVMKSMVHIPQSAIYYLDQNSIDCHRQLDNFWQRFTYMAKSRTKDIADGYRNIGCSEKVFN